MPSILDSGLVPHPPDSPLHIGFFSDVYLPMVNGVVVSMELLVHSLRAAGHSVTIFAPRFPGYHDTDAEVHRIPAVRYMRIPPVYIAVPGTPRAAWALRRTHFDILHVHSPLSIGLLGYFTSRIKHVPLIYTNHCSITDYTHYLKFGGQTRPVLWAARKFSSASANLSDQVVVPSAKFKKVLQGQNVQRPVHVIPHGIDLSNFYERKSPGVYRQQLGLGPDAHLLLYVGRLAPEKRVDILIDTFARVAARFSNAHFVIAGDGDARSRLEARAQASGYGARIHFLGMVKRGDLPGLLHDGTLFLSASTTETQCIALLEAIAAGLPLVAVWDEAFEGMLVDGVNGHVASPEPEAFGSAICNLLADQATRQVFGLNSVELSRKFSIEAQVNALIELYRATIKMNANGQRRTLPGDLN